MTSKLINFIAVHTVIVEACWVPQLLLVGVVENSVEISISN